MGLMRNLPYYYIGYVFGLYHLFRGTNKYGPFFGKLHYLTSSIFCLSGSILLFAWHLDAFYSGQHLLHIVLFYPVNIGFLFGVLYGCKLLNTIQWNIITNLSIGTLVIIGLHIVLVTIANFAIKHLLHINDIITYQWYEALPITLIIVVFFYPLILFSKNTIPIFIGRKRA
jgi:hypothetical protein